MPSVALHLNKDSWQLLHTTFVGGKLHLNPTAFGINEAGKRFLVDIFAPTSWNGEISGMRVPVPAVQVTNAFSLNLKPRVVPCFEINLIPRTSNCEHP